MAITQHGRGLHLAREASIGQLPKRDNQDGFTRRDQSTKKSSRNRPMESSWN